MTKPTITIDTGMRLALERLMSAANVEAARLTVAGRKCRDSGKYAHAGKLEDEAERLNDAVLKISNLIR